MNKVLLFNPRAAESKARVPNSILSIAASIEEKYGYAIVDGNLENNPLKVLLDYLGTGEYDVFACTVMPGPQLRQAIPFTKEIRKKYPHVKIVWGGYFASNHSQVSINSGYIDYIIYGPGDYAFPMLMDAIVRQDSFGETNTSLHQIPNLIFKENNLIVKTKKDELYDQDSLPPLPYEKLSSFYPMKKYIGKSVLGTKTFAYHSSVGCPFTCAFCGVVPIYNARWKGRSAEKIYSDIKEVKEKYEINAVEFYDSNFFVSEKRVVEFSKLVKNENLVWWGEGRIDTIDKYADESLALMREAGCKMIFHGAESGNDEMLKKMDKGGTQSGEQIKRFAARMAKFDIIPEYSFVVGTPAATEEEVNRQIDFDIQFIRGIKEINPKTEIIIYVYSPVPTEGSQLSQDVIKSGFHFPQTLDEWTSPQWENFDLHRNPLTPWLKPYMVKKIKDFETVLNGYYPTVTDTKLTPFRIKLLKLLSSPRYKTNWNKFPYEIKIMQRLFKYRQPEWEGF
jgi:anaerobic magnesium-protoporphyrin IX monomethyl ester cyclase